MTAPMLAALLCTLISTAAADGPTYVKYPASNAYRNHFGWYGGEHLDHCDGNVSTLQECEDWCSQDCECHCFFVYVPNGACQRRHSCNPDDFDTQSADFNVYVKEGHTGDCTKFQDLGFHTTCQGSGLNGSVATNVGSLEQCKNLCVMLSFECKGIQYRSNCADKTQDQCMIITSGTIDTGAVAQPEADDINTHCLKYTGPVGSSNDALLVPLSITMTGIDGQALLQDQQAVDAVGTAIKQEVAGLTSTEPDDVTVELRAGSLVADIQVQAESSADLIAINQGLSGADLQSRVVSAVDAVPAVSNFKTAPLEIGAFTLGSPNAVTLTDTTSTSVTMATTTETIFTTTTTSHCSGFELRLCVLGTLLMRFIIA